MPYTTSNRIQETTSTSGTGTLTLNGAVAGFQNFNNGIGIGNTTSYVIFDPTANVWEAGIGTLLTANTFGRTQVLSNSSGTTALISFAGNTSNIWCDYLAERSVTQFDVGTQANQIPLNQYLGTMAWQDAKAVNIQGGTATLTSLTVNGTSIPTNGIYLPAANTIGFSTNSTYSAEIDSSGYWRVGHNGAPSTTTQFSVQGLYNASAPATNSNVALRINQGSTVSLWASGYAYSYTWIQSIQDDGTNNLKSLYLNPLGGGVGFGGNINPLGDNLYTCGTAANRWSVIYAATGTINTSDASKKTVIGSLSDAEQSVAKTIKGLFKTFKFNNSIAEKGIDNARIHVGVIAQDVKAAFEAQGLDPNKYALFCSDTWYIVDGELKDNQGAEYTSESPNAVEVNQLGIRYEELLAFVISAI